MTINKCRSGLASSLFALALVAATTSNAAVIYDNGTPTTDNGYSIGGGSTADDFTIVSGGTVHSVGFFFQNYYGITGWDQQVTYSFLADSGGLPGAVLATGSAQNVTPTLSSYAWCCGGGNAWLVEFDLVSDFVAAAGSTYWLGLTGAGGPSPWWVTASPSGSGNGVLNFTTNIQHEFAFYLSGTNVGQANNVPEPASFALAAIGLLGLGVARRRMRKEATS